MTGHAEQKEGNGPAVKGPRAFMMRWPVQLFLLPLVYGLVFFLAAGRLDYLWGWVFLAIYLLASLTTLIAVRDPALIAERERPPSGVKAWDERLLRLYSLAMLAVMATAGLNVRFAWPPTPPAAVHLLGLLCLAGTIITGNWAMRVNTYFSAYVRIQADRGQVVIRSGPYRTVRHPGNLGMILWAVGVPLVLGSFWALIPGLAAAGLVVVRTAREDATLLAELPGYDDYAREVRYRLLPGVW